MYKPAHNTLTYCQNTRRAHPISASNSPVPWIPSPLFVERRRYPAFFRARPALSPVALAVRVLQPDHRGFNRYVVAAAEDSKACPEHFATEAMCRRALDPSLHPHCCANSRQARSPNLLGFYTAGGAAYRPLCIRPSGRASS